MQKRFYTQLCLLFSLLTILPMQGFCTGIPYWQDAAVLEVNREKPVTEFALFSTRSEAIRGNFDQSPFIRSLNGVWDFRYFDTFGEMPDSIEKNFTAEPSERIQVPGNWELQGFGTAIYVNTHYEFAPLNPQPPLLPQATPVGVYHRTFSVPTAWSGRTVFLNLCGVKSGTYIYVNGQEVGYGEDSKDLARYDITPYLRSGENELVLKVYRWSTGSYLECQDFWRISGIERDVYLSSTAANTLSDFTVTATLDDTCRNGQFALSMFLHGNPQQTVSYELLDKTGRAVLSGEVQAHNGKADFRGEIADVAAWSAESPTLYRLVMRVGGEYIPFAVGFTRFEMADAPQTDASDRPYKVLLVNGQPIKFKGVNLHEHSPYTGHYVSPELMRQDLALMRRNNINAVRTCHYPQPRYFYELCDSLGLYVYSEANLESHGMGYDLKAGGTLGNNPRWYDAHLDRILNMYYRCRNYTSVAILSLGNEAGNGYNFYKSYEAVKALETRHRNRPVCYERAEFEWNTDMLVPQYPSAEWLERMGREGSDRPVCPSEYAHAMGNSTGSFDLQWDAIYRYPNLQGGFIWDWVDQGFDKTTADGRHFWAYGGDYGVDTPSDANFVCNGLVNPDRQPHPALREVKYTHSNIRIDSLDTRKGRYRVNNRFYFTDLSPYRLCYEIRRDGKSVLRGSAALHAAAQLSEEIAVRVPRMTSGDEYTIDFAVVTTREERLVPVGDTIAWQQFVLQPRRKQPYTPAAEPIRVEQTETSITLRSERMQLVFDKQQGYVTSYRVANRELLADGFGLRPNFWRAPNDNDYGNGEPFRCQAWKQAGRQFDADAQVQSGDRGTELCVNYRLATGNSYRVIFRPDAKGILHIACLFRGIATDSPLDIPRIGLRWRIPADNDRFSYYGLGPQENYWDRQSSAVKGNFSTSATAQYYPYVRPQESGHHCATEWISTNTMTLVADSLFEFNLLRCATEDLDSEEATSCDYQWTNYAPDEPHDTAAAQNRLRRQHHTTDVPVRDWVEVSLDFRQSGVGGYDSWGARTERARTLWNDTDYAFGFALVPTSALTADQAKNRLFK